MTTCCWSTPPRSSARARSRRRGARSSPTPPTTATAPATVASSGLRLHALFALDGTPRALALTSPKVDEKEVCLTLVSRCERRPGQVRSCRRQELPRQGLRSRAGRARREDRPPAPQGRARPRSPPGPDPPADRVDLLDRQGHPRPRAPRRSHLAQPVRADGDALRRTGSRRDAQLRTRPPQPLAGLLHDLIAWGTTHLGGFGVRSLLFEPISVLLRLAGFEFVDLGFDLGWNLFGCSHGRIEDVSADHAIRCESADDLGK